MNNYINKIINADCLEVMKTMPDNFVDLTVTSPPYNIGINRKSSFKIKKYNSYDDNLPKEKYFLWLGKVINELLRVNKYHIFLNIYEYQPTKGLIHFLYDNFHKNIKEVFIWFKTNPVPAVNNLGQLSYGFEYVFCFSKDNPESKKFSYHNLKENQFISNAFKLGVNSDNNGHNYGFPINLPKYFINYFSKKGDLIYDPFSGSGTTCLAALQMDRNYIGIEIDKQYYDLSVKRVNTYKSQLKMEFQ